MMFEPNSIVVMRSDEPRFAKYNGIVRADRLLALHPDPCDDGGRRWLYERAKIPAAVGHSEYGCIPEKNLGWVGAEVDAELTRQLRAGEPLRVEAAAHA